MKTITTHEAKTHLSRYLAEVEKGARFTIARGKTVVAMLVPVQTAKNRARPEVGRIEGAPFDYFRRPVPLVARRFVGLVRMSQEIRVMSDRRSQSRCRAS